MNRSVRRVLAIAAVPAVAVALLVASDSPYPSGEAPPPATLPGWKQIFVDDFTGPALRQEWGPYEGSPGNDPRTKWALDQVVVADGRLVLEGTRVGDLWTTGGISNYKVAQTYGKWLVRFRVDRSDDITYAILLWPEEPVWPPEIDFAEDGGGIRDAATATLHYSAENSQIQREVPGDFSTWHTVGVEWMPGQVSYTLDGRVWTTVEDAGVPSIPMWMAIQAQGDGCRKDQVVCPVAGTPDTTRLEVDWVAVYAPDPPPGVMRTPRVAAPSG